MTRRPGLWSLVQFSEDDFNVLPHVGGGLREVGKRWLQACQANLERVELFGGVVGGGGALWYEELYDGVI